MFEKHRVLQILLARRIFAVKLWLKDIALSSFDRFSRAKLGLI
jgi:hypothetical protein